MNRFIIKITDYCYGGHINYIKIIGNQYVLVPERKHATILSYISEISHFYESLKKQTEREITLNYVVDTQLLDHLTKI